MDTDLLKEKNYLVARVTFVISIAIISSLKIICQKLCWHYAFKYQSGSAWTRYKLGSDQI